MYINSLITSSGLVSTWIININFLHEKTSENFSKYLLIKLLSEQILFIIRPRNEYLM